MKLKCTITIVVSESPNLIELEDFLNELYCSKQFEGQPLNDYMFDLEPQEDHYKWGFTFSYILTFTSGDHVGKKILDHVYHNWGDKLYTLFYEFVDIADLSCGGKIAYEPGQKENSVGEYVKTHWLNEYRLSEDYFDAYKKYLTDSGNNAEPDVAIYYYEVGDS